MMRDTSFSKKKLGGGPTDPLSYGFVDACQTCGHEWKPRDV
jgi:hypothetical protein